MLKLHYEAKMPQIFMLNQKSVVLKLNIAIPGALKTLDLQSFQRLCSPTKISLGSQKTKIGKNPEKKPVVASQQ